MHPFWASLPAYRPDMFTLSSLMCFFADSLATAGWFHPFETWAKLPSWFTARLWAALLLAYQTGILILLFSLVGMFIDLIHSLPCLMMSFHVKLEGASQCAVLLTC